ncbi:hypothetical protein [Sandaracinobacteroides hominis]|uniref:hypothetical protein n=1 Tax=Sandaracinobacteroides hominis TaxID=2780086 RepID=UPI001F254F90|nr:hypothetical protein [Sandaracinobacteroides hominis]
MATHREDKVYVEPERREMVYREERGPGGVIFGVVLVAVLALAIAWALGLFNVDTSGKLEAPEVAVTGGEVPTVQVETADVNVGTEKKTIEVPTVSVTKPGDDGSASN